MTVLMLLLTWLLVSVPASLLLGRAMTRSTCAHPAEPLAVTEWRREPAAA